MKAAGTHRVRVSMLVMAAGLGVALLGGVASAQVDKPMPGAPAAPNDPRVKSAGEIKFSEQLHDWGTIPDDTRITHDFKFTNVGPGTLNILEAKGSCGCTVPALAKKTYAPGESGSIKVEFNPHNRRGPQHTTVTVTTDDPQHPTVILEIKSEVKPVVSFEPQMIAIGVTPRGTPKTFSTKIVSRVMDLKFLSATPNLGMLEAKLGEPKQVEVNGEKMIEVPLDVTVKGDAAVGPVVGNVSVRTSDPNRILNLMVSGEVTGDVQVVPANVQLGRLAFNQPINHVVRLMSRNGKPFKIVKITEQTKMSPFFSDASTTEREVKAVIEEDTSVKPSAWIVRLSAVAPDKQVAARGELRIETDLPEERFVTVPYFGFTAPAPQQAQPAGASPTGGGGWDANPSTLVPR
jgi:hypothetical protein